MARFFNTSGPCRPVDHYMLPPERRLPELLSLVEQQQYFVVHAARQSGKTTAMLAFAERLRGMGYVAAWTTLETSQGVTDPAFAEPQWLSSLGLTTRHVLPESDRPPELAFVQDQPVGERLRHALAAWSERVAPRPVVLLLDEADVVTGPALVSLLRQLRAGFTDRGPGRFPSSVALIGMRDLRDYLAAAKDGLPVNPGSPFNIKSDSLTLRNFSEAEVAELYAQHTQDTGQPFTAAAVARAYYWTGGQPFLVNALARKLVTELAPDPTCEIDAPMVDGAKERLILSRTTHLDALTERLKEPRVARIVQAVLAGDIPRTIPYDSDDFQYVVDLGLLRRGPEGAEPANPLYREILARQVTYNTQESLTRPWWRWQTPDGGLDLPALVDAFLGWWRENADALVEDIPLYPEAVPHIAFMAFLQRVVNGGGKVLREYAGGRRAVDLVVEYGPDRFVIELKRVRPRDGLDTVRQGGIVQLSAYLDLLGVAEGWLIVFDQRPGLTWEERLWREEVEVDGRRLWIRGA